jgi:AcrR family transcriptional regulator
MGTPHVDSKRSDLLRAASEIVREQGYGALTLDAVAARAGTSKGGLLYHFRSKEALVAALVEALVDGFEAGLAHQQQEDSRTPGAFTRAYVRASTAPTRAGEDATASALIAAVSMDPAMLEPLRRRYAVWRRAFTADGLAGVDAHVAGLAADGLWLADLLDLKPPTGALRKRIRDRLVQLAGGGTHASA